MPQYFFSNRNLCFLTDADIVAMYNNAVPIKTIAKRVSLITGDSVRATLPIVQGVIYRHSVWSAPINPMEHLSVFDPPRADTPVPLETRAEKCAEIDRKTWAVGDLCTRRY